MRVVDEGVPLARRGRAATGSIEIRVELVGAPYPIWRTIAIAPDCSLADLHMAIQGAMGWQEMHLHDFIFDGTTTFGYADIESPEEELDEEMVELGQYLSKGMTFDYRYDFGDNWVHRCTVVATRRKLHLGPPVILDGAGDAPSEDGGGVNGFKENLDTIERLRESGVDVDNPDWAEYIPSDSDQDDRWGAEESELLTWWHSWGRPKPFTVEAQQAYLDRFYAGEDDEFEDDEWDELWEDSQPSASYDAISAVPPLGPPALSGVPSLPRAPTPGSPTPTWVREHASKLHAAIARRGMSMNPDVVVQLISERVQLIATQMGMSPNSVRPYLEDQDIEAFADGIVAQLEDEAPGEDLTALPRSPVPLALIGVLVSGVAQAQLAQATRQQPVPGIDVPDMADLLTSLGIILRESSMSNAESALAPFVPLPDALLRRGARYLEVASDAQAESPTFPRDKADVLASRFRSDAELLLAWLRLEKTPEHT